MPRYLIERELPGAGDFTNEQLYGIAQKSCDIVEEMGSQIQWVESFVSDNKIYCIYLAPDKALIMQHASMGGFPANRIEEIKTVINPVTAEKRMGEL